MSAEPYLDPTDHVSDRVDDLLSRMTLLEEPAQRHVPAEVPVDVRLRRASRITVEATAVREGVLASHVTLD